MVYLLFILSFLILCYLKTEEITYDPFINVGGVEKKKSRFGLKFLLQRIFEPSIPSEAPKHVKRKHAIVSSIGHFLSIFSGVAFFFSVLQLWLDVTTNVDRVAASILKIEQAQFKIKEFIGWFKIGSFSDIAIITVLISLAAALPFIERYKVKDRYKKINKAIKTVAYVLTISCSFTFFGNKFSKHEESREGKLTIHKFQIIEDNKLLLKKIQQVVTDEVVNAILSDKKISDLLDKVDRITENLERPGYNNNEHDHLFLSNLDTLALKLNIPNTKHYDFNGSFVDAELRFSSFFKENLEAEISTLDQLKDETSDVFKLVKSPESDIPIGAADDIVPDFYKLQEETQILRFVKQHPELFDKEILSPELATKAMSTLRDGIDLSQPKYSNRFLSRYREPYEKLVKKVYSVSIKKWVTAGLEIVGVEFPFLGEFIDPILHDPIQDMIVEKTAKIFTAANNGQVGGVAHELRSCRVQQQEFIKQATAQSEKFKTLEAKIENDLIKSQALKSDVNKAFAMELEKETSRINDFLSNISARSRWEAVRRRFYDRLIRAEFDDFFDSRQVDQYKFFFRQWNEHKLKNKTNWYLNGQIDLEHSFFDFIKSDATAKACWGFILQQEDWDGAVHFYTIKKPDPNATGKPFYLLKYYFESTGRGDVDELYDDKTNNRVGDLCPPH